MNKKDIQKIINDFNVNEICRLLDECFDDCIKDFKLNDFLVDIRGTNKYCEKLKLIENSIKTNKAIKYIRDLKIINKIFAECTKLQNQINQVPPNQVLPLMFYYGSKNIDAYMSDTASKVFKTNNADKVVSYERSVDMTIKAIKSLMYNDKLYDGTKFIHDFDSLKIVFSRGKYQKCIIDYIRNSFLASQWFEKYEFWKKGIYDISVINEDEIRLNITDKSLIEKEMNPYIKDRIYQCQYESSVIVEHNLNNYSSNSKKDLRVFEFISKKVIHKHFYCNCDNMLIKNVKIKYWIRAYFTLFNISQLDVDKIVPTLSISAFILDNIRCKTKKKWIKIFIKNGIPLESAAIIFDNLVFNKKSTDLYDYPFIPVHKKYLLSRTISKWIHPAEVLISRFNSQDIDVSIKGKNFEKCLYEFFDYVRIPYVKLHNKVNGVEYECDAVFYLDNTFVFCECKSRTGHKLETSDSKKYIEDASQLNRIAEFYKQNMTLVFEEFSKKGVKIKDKKFYKTQNVVIHSGTVDGVLQIDKVYIMDFNTFLIPFDRGSFFEDYINDNKVKKVFEGDITIHKLFKFYNYDFCIYDYRKRLVYGDNNIELGEMKISVEDFYLSNFFNEDLSARENMIQTKNMLRHCGIAENRINEIVKK